MFLEENFDSNPGLQIGEQPKSNQLQDDNNNICPVLTKVRLKPNQIDHTNQINENQSQIGESTSSRNASAQEDLQNTAVTAEPPATTIHPMTTQACNGIRKPNQRYVLNISAEPALPVGIKAALADSV